MEPISFEKVTPEEAKAVLDARDKTDKPKKCRAGKALAGKP